MNRRKFLKLCGLITHGLAFGFGTIGCVIPPKDINWTEVPNKEFTIDRFDDWFYFHKLYNGLNPYLKLQAAGYSPTFKGSIMSGWTPGIDYSSNYIYAAADGVVYNIHSLNTGRLGGDILNVTHSIGKYIVPTMVTRYAHLGTVYVKDRDKVKRGDLLATVEYTNNAKLMLQTPSGNYVDPDNYGENHGHMKYYDGLYNPEVLEPEQKHRNQRIICGKLCSYILPEIRITSSSLFSRVHVKKSDILCIWDNFEVFKYITELYNAKPNLFPKLSESKFNEYKKEFHINQPVILTLPLKT